MQIGVNFTSNGQPKKVYHWNLPQRRKWKEYRNRKRPFHPFNHKSGNSFASFKPKQEYKEPLSLLTRLALPNISPSDSKKVSNGLLPSSKTSMINEDASLESISSLKKSLNNKGIFNNNNFLITLNVSSILPSLPNVTDVKKNKQSVSSSLTKNSTGTAKLLSDTDAILSTSDVQQDNHTLHKNKDLVNLLFPIIRNQAIVTVAPKFANTFTNSPIFFVAPSNYQKLKIKTHQMKGHTFINRVSGLRDKDAVTVKKLNKLRAKLKFKKFVHANRLHKHKERFSNRKVAANSSLSTINSSFIFTTALSLDSKVQELPTPIKVHDASFLNTTYSNVSLVSQLPKDSLSTIGFVASLHDSSKDASVSSPSVPHISPGTPGYRSTLNFDELRPTGNLNLISADKNSRLQNIKLPYTLKPSELGVTSIIYDNTSAAPSLPQLRNERVESSILPSFYSTANLNSKYYTNNSSSTMSVPLVKGFSRYDKEDSRSKLKKKKLDTLRKFNRGIDFNGRPAFIHVLHQGSNVWQTLSATQRQTSNRRGKYFAPSDVAL